MWMHIFLIRMRVTTLTCPSTTRLKSAPDLILLSDLRGQLSVRLKKLTAFMPNQMQVCHTCIQKESGWGLQKVLFIIFSLDYIWKYIQYVFTLDPVRTQTGYKLLIVESSLHQFVVIFFFLKKSSREFSNDHEVKFLVDTNVIYFLNKWSLQKNFKIIFLNLCLCNAEKVLWLSTCIEKYAF